MIPTMKEETEVPHPIQEQQTSESRRPQTLLERMTFLPPLIAGVMRRLHGSCEFTILGQENEDAACSQGHPIIYTAWHFAFPAVIYHLRDRNGMVMVSRSRDGEWMTRILKHMGFHSARGSTHKGGSAALRQVISHLRKGNPGGFIADGSQGPALVAQKGILLLARYARAPLVPVSMAAHPCWRFRSWDRTVLAKPFSRIALAFGPPLWVDASASPERLEEMRQDLELSLNALTRRCESALRPAKTPDRTGPGLSGLAM